MYNLLYSLQQSNPLFVSLLSRIPLLGLVITFPCFLPATSIAQQDVIQRFQQKINELEQRIERLESLLGAQTSSLQEAPLPLNRWQDPQNWQHLQMGMLAAQVERLLGPPPQISAGAIVRWYYPDPRGGHVSFDKEMRVMGWNTP